LGFITEEFGAENMNSFLKKSYSDILEKILNILIAERRACNSEIDSKVFAVGAMSRHHLTRDREDRVIKAAISGNLRINFKD
jgi:hypothetical protein